MKYLNLVLKFMKIGTFTFGGGFAMISFIEKEIVEKEQWITQEEFDFILASVQMYPGAIALNMATVIGKNLYGIKGALSAVVGVLFTPFTLIVILYPVINQVTDMPLVQGIFRGINGAIILLILGSALKMIKNVPRNLFNYIFLIAGIGLVLLGMDTYLILVLSLLIGFCSYLFGRKLKEV